MANKIENNSSTSRAALCSLLGSLGLLVIAVAVLIPIISGGFPESPLYKWLYSAGAAICLGASLFTKAPAGADLRERRWVRVEAWSSLFFCAGAFFLWYPGSTARDWLAFTLAGAVIRIIVFFRSVKKPA
ncbi:MAG: hypothetical protein HFJ87_08455 [Muribaculaceae bacterium]|nr:hypothetical protein [Muribaculaceae bacterium]MCI9055155.1 hypothetical protein [Muribaculaceae bacterium]